jgi:hypothetical protein
MKGKGGMVYDWTDCAAHIYNTMYIRVITCIFTYICSQKHNNSSAGITMYYATLRNTQLHVSAF